MVKKPTKIMGGYVVHYTYKGKARIRTVRKMSSIGKMQTEPGVDIHHVFTVAEYRRAAKRARH